MSRAPTHQRDQVIAEAAQEQRRQQVDHHDHAVHGDELVVVARVDEGNVSGKPSCSRIIADSTSATRPTKIAVTAYWIAMTLWSWLQMYLVMKVCGIVQVCVQVVGVGVGHRVVLSARVVTGVRHAI